MTTLLHEMEKRDVKYGLQTMCIGFGQATCTIIERLARQTRYNRFSARTAWFSSS